MRRSRGRRGDGAPRPSYPNFFIAVQITNPAIIKKIEEVQKSVTQQRLVQPWNGIRSTRMFTDAMMPIAKLHFTLNVMYLKDDVDIQKAKAVLAEVGSILEQEMKENPMNLTIEGLGDFDNRVVHAKIKEKKEIDRLVKVHELFQEKFHEHMGIPIDQRPFTPHLTIGNVSRDRNLRYKGIQSFSPNMWSDFQDTSFGTQLVSGIQLLRMGGDDCEYYRCFGQFNFYK